MRKVRKTRAPKKNRPVRGVRRGKPNAKSAPSLLGMFKGRMEIVGDIISPINVEWTGDEENLRKSPELWRDDE
jgi:hypothetical protein